MRHKEVCMVPIEACITASYTEFGVRSLANLWGYTWFLRHWLLPGTEPKWDGPHMSQQIFILTFLFRSYMHGKPMLSGYCRCKNLWVNIFFATRKTLPVFSFLFIY